MKNVKKRVLSIIVVVALLACGGTGAVLLYRARQAAVPVEAQAEEAAIPVNTESPALGSLEVVTEFIGRVQPDESVSVYPKVAGTVLATHFEVGQPVKKGDLLFEIDPTDIETQVAVAEAAYNVAKVSVDSALGSALDLKLLDIDSKLRSAKESFSSANKAYTDYIDDFDPKVEKLEESRDSLYDAMKALEAGYDAANTAYKAAEKAYDDAYKMSLAPPPGMSGIAEMLAQLEYEMHKASNTRDDVEKKYNSAKAAYEQMKQTYNETKDGYDVNLDKLKTTMRTANIALDTVEQTDVITNEKALPEAKATADAQLAQAGASLEATRKQLEYTKVTSPIDGVIEQKSVEEHGLASQSAAAYVVTNKEIMVVTFNVPANAAQSMAVGDPLSIENGSAVYTGSVIEVNSMADSKSGLFPVKARIDAEPGQLLNGVTVKVSAPTSRVSEALLIPIDSLYHEDGRSYVYLLGEDGIARKTYVETGISDNERIVIVSGLAADAKLITSWNPNLKDGVQVTDAQTADAGAQSASAPGSSAPAAAEAAASGADLARTGGQEG